MAKLFKIEAYAADHTFYQGNLISITVPTIDGEYQILANHANLILAIVPGIITVKYEDESLDFAACSSGILKVENNEVLLLVDSIERPEEIDLNRAKRAYERAQEKILRKQSKREYIETHSSLLRALYRIKAKEKFEHN